MTNLRSTLDESTFRRFGLPVLLAIVMTAQNALKPPCIDDTAYLAVARQIASHPFDPYGFQQFWYEAPQNANEILAPPVIPYWLGLGIALFGEQIVLLKLWLFPIALLLCFAVRALLHRFARGVEAPVLIGFILSPAILPGFNLMLDIPELALAAAAIAIFLAGLDRDSWPRVVLASLLAGIAFETKYTGAIILPVYVAAGILNRRPLRGFVAALVALCLIGVWEEFTRLMYGASHFLFAVHGSPEDFGKKLGYMANAAPALLGSLGPPLIFLAIAGFRWRWVIAPAVVLLTAGFVLRAAMPGLSAWMPDFDERAQDDWLNGLTEAPWGWAFIGLTLIVAVRLLVRGRRGARRIQLSSPVIFLLIWLWMEWAGFLVLASFPASRRMLGVILAATLLFARLASRTCRSPEARRRLSLAIVPGVVLGLFFAAVDISCSWVEPEALRAAADWIAAQHSDGKIWFTGHWGFQYAAMQHGFEPLNPGVSNLKEGDWLIAAPLWMLPQDFVPDDAAMGSPVYVAQVDRWLRLRTLPAFYGGKHAIEWWPNPVLEVPIYRIQSDWRPLRSAKPSR